MYTTNPAAEAVANNRDNTTLGVGFVTEFHRWVQRTASAKLYRTFDSQRAFRPIASCYRLLFGE
jgi:hypothetical protein